MPNTSTFSFANKDAGTSVGTVSLGLCTNYGRIMDEPTEARVSNKTCTLDQGEIITYRCRDLKSVNSYMPVLYPAVTQNGIEFGARVDELLRTTNSTGDVVCDEPIVATLTIKAPKSSHITSDVITEVVSRLLGACYNETDKVYRWDDMMRSSLIPTEG